MTLLLQKMPVHPRSTNSGNGLWGGRDTFQWMQNQWFRRKQKQYFSHGKRAGAKLWMSYGRKELWTLGEHELEIIYPIFFEKILVMHEHACPWMYIQSQETFTIPQLPLLLLHLYEVTAFPRRKIMSLILIHLS